MKVQPIKFWAKTPICLSRNVILSTCALNPKMFQGLCFLPKRVVVDNKSKDTTTFSGPRLSFLNAWLRQKARAVTVLAVLVSAVAGRAGEPL